MGEGEAHVLLVALGTQGHFLPGLHLANTLSQGGLHVTLATSASAVRRLPKLPSSSPRLSFALFSDGLDDGFHPGNDVVHFLSQFQLHASKSIRQIIANSKSQPNPFTFILYSLLTPWMASLARSFNLPSALFWNQSASVFAIYFHFFNGYRHLIQNSFSHNNDNTISLPGLPSLTPNELPSLCHPSNSHSPVLELFEAHFQVLNQEPHLKILVNSFHELEIEAVSAITTFVGTGGRNVKLVPIGPVFPSPSPDCDHFLDANNDDITAWLNSKPKSSVVYVSFGSIAAVSKAQLEEIGRGLLEWGGPFLWVMRKMGNGRDEGEMLRCREEVEGKGKIVSWCSQLEVLSNPGTGCFLTHCGWNSSLESLVCGVPVVGFPQWTDQGTNAMIIQDLARTGVRLRLNRDAIVERGEIKRCLQLVMGDGVEREVFRRNAFKWKERARNAVTDGGSSDTNIKAFVNEVRNMAIT